MKCEGLLFLSVVIAFAMAAPTAPTGSKRQKFQDIGKILDFVRNWKAQRPSSLNELASLEGIDNDVSELYSNI